MEKENNQKYSNSEVNTIVHANNTKFSGKHSLLTLDDYGLIDIFQFVELLDLINLTKTCSRLQNMQVLRNINILK